MENLYSQVSYIQGYYFPRVLIFPEFLDSQDSYMTRVLEHYIPRILYSRSLYSHWHIFPGFWYSPDTIIPELYIARFHIVFPSPHIPRGPIFLCFLYSQSSYFQTGPIFLEFLFSQGLYIPRIPIIPGFTYSQSSYYPRIPIFLVFLFFHRLYINRVPIFPGVIYS